MGFYIVGMIGVAVWCSRGALFMIYHGRAGWAWSFKCCYSFINLSVPRTLCAKIAGGYRRDANRGRSAVEFGGWPHY